MCTDTSRRQTAKERAELIFPAVAVHIAGTSRRATDEGLAGKSSVSDELVFGHPVAACSIQTICMTVTSFLQLKEPDCGASDSMTCGTLSGIF
jgi:hypothetical protein